MFMSPFIEVNSYAVGTDSNIVINVPPSKPTGALAAQIRTTIRVYLAALMPAYECEIENYGAAVPGFGVFSTPHTTVTTQSAKYILFLI